LKQSDQIKTPHSGKVIVKNTVYNLSGNIIPVLFAVLLIPPLLKGLGTEKFGILGIAWMITGYFSFFDFGIGRGITKIIAEKIGINETAQIPTIFWTSIFIVLSISLFVSICLLFFVPTIVSLFNISKALQEETTSIFYFLLLSIPIVTTMVGLRGFLEAHQKFRTINIIRVSLGISSFLLPLIIMLLLNSLFWIVVSLILMRFFVWFIYLLECFKADKSIREKVIIDFMAFKPVMRFSIWITVGNMIVPIILYSDRFLIGILISASAITYYITPYEVVTKLLLISIAFSGVLFPVFSRNYINTPELARKILIRGVKFILLSIYPIVLILETFAFEGIEIWLGREFAMKSYLVLQFLAIGVLMNSISLIPNIFFQGIGKPKIPTIINLVEFPFYIFIMWIAIKNFGINGAAFTFMVMATIDAATMYIFANKMNHINLNSKDFYLGLILMAVGLILPFLFDNIYLKLAYVIFFILSFLILSWKYFLSNEEKSFIVLKLQMK